MPMSKAISIVMIAFAEALEHDPEKWKSLSLVQCRLHQTSVTGEGFDDRF